MRVLKPGQKVVLNAGREFGEEVLGTIETFHLYQDGSHAYSIVWWDDRRLASSTFFENSFELPEDPIWLEVSPAAH